MHIYWIISNRLSLSCVTGGAGSFIFYIAAPRVARDASVPEIFDALDCFPVHNPIQPNQHARRERHEETRCDEEPVISISKGIQPLIDPVSLSPYPLRRVQHLENGVRVEAVELVTPLDPKPVPEGDAPAQCQGGEEGDGVGWREEEQVDHEGQRWDGMEGEVGVDGERRRPIGEDELRIHLWPRLSISRSHDDDTDGTHRSQAPVEQADQTLHRGAGHAQHVLDLEQRVVHGDVRQQADRESGSGQ